MGMVFYKIALKEIIKFVSRDWTQEEIDKAKQESKLILNNLI